MPTSSGMRTHTGFLERTKWMVTDRGGRLAMELVYCRLVGSYCQSTSSTIFDVLSHHLPNFCPTKLVAHFGSMQIPKTRQP